MKSALATLLIFGFFGIAVLGFLAISHENAHGICLFTAAGGGRPPCPINDPLGFANFHINIFKGFSTATFADSVAVAFLAAWFLCAAVMLAVLAPRVFGKAVQLFFVSAESPPDKAAMRDILRWLSLLEKSPTLI